MKNYPVAQKICTVLVKELISPVTLLEEALWRWPEETNHSRHVPEFRFRPTTGIISKQVFTFNTRPYLEDADKLALEYLLLV